MREILFRGKRSDNSEWIYGNLISFWDKTFIAPSYTNTFHRVEIVPETVGQWTGFKDKNNKRIFEGDIMRNDGNVVEYCNGSFCINGDSPIAYWTGTEVIGNIYDNPKLLKGDNI